MTDKINDKLNSVVVKVDIQKIYNETLHSLNELANKNHHDSHVYALSLKQHRDFINVIDTVKEETKNQAKTDGKFLEKLETAKRMLEKGFDIKTIIEITKLTEELLFQKILNRGDN